MKLAKPVASKEDENTSFRYEDPRAQKYLKRGVESKMLPEEKEDYELDQEAQALQEQAIREYEEEKKRKKRQEMEELEYIRGE